MELQDVEEPVLFFDGVCNLCNSVIQFTIERDDEKRFRFAPLQSGIGEQLMEREDLDAGELETFVLLEDETIYTRSDAAVKLLEGLGGRWRVLASVLSLVPRSLRDLGYRLVAGNRYRLFGKRDSCMAPSPGVEDRFLGTDA